MKWSAENIRRSCQREFGFAHLKPGQGEIIASVMEGNDCLAILPTGGGKSLCYQLPAILREGCALVVSPLISLMQDQVESLTDRGIAACAIHSGLSLNQLQACLSNLRHQHYKLVYVAPERFRNRRFLETLDNLSVSLFVVDEAHCISMWGHDFRPDYQRLTPVLEKLSDCQVLACTATATPQVQEDIVCQLGLGTGKRTAPRVIVRGFARPNLFLKVFKVHSHAEKLKRVMTVLKDYPSAIIYCATRKNVEKVHDLLIRKEVENLLYHAGLSDDERFRTQELFLKGHAPVVVATNAFGMGVDRKDVRAVLHWDVPGSLEAWYQEAGRAGRDGKPAHAEILYTYADVRTQEFFLDGANPKPELVNDLVRSVKTAHQKSPKGLLGSQVLGHLSISTKNDIAINTAFNLLEKAGFLECRIDPHINDRLVFLTDENADLDPVLKGLAKKRQKDELRLKRMLRFIGSHGCRHENILSYFGDPERKSTCQACDNCSLQESPEDLGNREPNTEEEWIEIQKILSCVARLKGRFGRLRIIQVLKGSQEKDLIQRGLHQLPTHGVCKNLSQSYLHAMLDELERARCIEVDGEEYPKLRLTALGWDVMRRESTVKIVWPQKESSPKRVKITVPKKSKETRIAPTPPNEMVSAELVESLKNLRIRLSKAKSVPPYIVFSNQTMYEIARIQPSTLAELEQCKGIGPAKLKKYGKAILEAIN